ncbi:MAG: sugar ABC transporter substrate-binding protein [Vannielia sp.]|uniref:sugar ABC transporter substrate-binding protein n=1 Tax=Rhodobacterales TaxID=204455 RepID=UPI002095CF9C|nr:sugar ABC transporter substrate-binding protein [Oceanicola sp. 502str15]MCO6384120.1 substrate-binding domain-containing protein [Oceanicola sp. 502str15]
MNIIRRGLLAGAAAATLVATGPVMAQDKPVIAVLPKTVINDVFMNNVAEFAKAKGAELGVEIEIHSVSGHGAIEEQVSAMEALISRGVDGIALAALDGNGLAPSVKRAAAAGIPVVLVDGGVQTDEANYVTLVATDNARAAGLAADYAASLLSYSGKVAQLEGEPGSEAAALRREGFHESIAKYDGIELVSSVTGHWTTPGAVEATEAILSANPELDLIFASSDLMAVGAAEVLRRNDRQDILVIGFDGIPEGTDLILEDRAAGDVSQSAKGMGETSVEILAAIAAGDKTAADFPKRIDSGMLLLHKWNVADYRRDILGIAE